MGRLDRLTEAPESGNAERLRTGGSWIPRRWLALAVTALLAASSATAFAQGGNPTPPAVQVAVRGEAPRPAPSGPSTTTNPTTSASPAAPVPPSTGGAVPSPTISTARPPTTTGPTATARPTAATRAVSVAKPPSLLGPRSPGTVVVPFTAGRATWDGVSNGIVVHVAISPAAPRVGDSVQFHVEAVAGDLACCGLYMVFGDGGTSTSAMSWPNGDCAGAASGTAAADYTHVYNRAGRWEFSLQAASGHCGNDNIYGALHGYIAIEPGQPTTQGPAQPRAIVAEARAPGQPIVPGAIEVHAEGRDDDGFVARLIIDFGDGSTPEIRPGDPSGCRPTPAGWPAASWGWTLAPYPSHHYATPGSFVIAVTVVSSGCDGAGEQTSSASMTYTW